MLDLKSKLLAAGLVTKEQADLATKKRKPFFKKKSSSTTAHVSFEEQNRQKQLNELKSLPKLNQYELIRKWVSKNRIDVVSGLPSEKAQKYFFKKSDKNISWLTLEPEVLSQIHSGSAGIIAYMSNHGLAHSVMPKDIVEDVAEVFPAWLRTLKGHPLDPIEEAEKQAVQ